MDKHKLIRIYNDTKEISEHLGGKTTKYTFKDIIENPSKEKTGNNDPTFIANTFKKVL
jgi:hypothetical protein